MKRDCPSVRVARADGCVRPPVTRSATKKATGLTRRQTLLAPGALLAGWGCGSTSLGDEPPYNAMGERVGEVTDHSAIVHARLTANPTRNNLGYHFPIYRHILSLDELDALLIPEGFELADLEGACPGKAGRARLLYAAQPQLFDATETDWAEVGPETDFTQEFFLNDLTADTHYYYAVEMTGAGGGEARRTNVGHFRTAPQRDQWGAVKFFVITGQDNGCRDHLEGYKSYEAMIRLGGDFLVSTGDSVYYDMDPPIVRTIEMARYHWQRIYSLPLVVKLFNQMSGYWIKDDHDAFEDDCWATRPPDRVEPLTYQDLAPIFLEQMPMGESTYRHIRWGKGVEMWFVEGRDFRSPNPDPDGPNKTLWGADQKEWLKRTLLASEAQFRVLISPTSIVGPDSPGRVKFEMPGGGADSHGDRGFGYEGREFRHWARDNGLNNLVIVNGDRHWQYHSVDPETGLNEFSCGALTDRHSSVDKQPDQEYQRYLRGRGGFLSVSLEGSEQQPKLAMRFHDVFGEVTYEFTVSA